MSLNVIANGQVRLYGRVRSPRHRRDADIASEEDDASSFDRRRSVGRCRTTTSSRRDEARLNGTEFKISKTGSGRGNRINDARIRSVACLRTRRVSTVDRRRRVRRRARRSLGEGAPRLAPGEVKKKKGGFSHLHHPAESGSRILHQLLHVEVHPRELDVSRDRELFPANTQTPLPSRSVSHAPCALSPRVH